MEVRIVDQKANPLLHRNEFKFVVTHPTAPTPKRDEVRQELAKLTHTTKDRVVIEWMHAKFGTAETLGEGAAYDSKEAAEGVAREHILVRNGLKERAAKPGTPASEAAPAEAPAPTPATAPDSAPKESE